MFKLVVLSALLALVSAKPSFHTALVAPVHTVYAAPAAVSHQSRVDVHSAPVHAAWAAPVHSAWAAPVHSAWAAPLHSAWAAPVHSEWAAPLALGHNTPAVVLGPHGVPLDTAEVVAAKALHYQAKALSHHYIHKRSLYAAPLAYSTVLAPAAVSHQSRVDVHSKPLVAVAPWVHSYAAPYVSHYAAPWSTSTYWGKRAYGVHPW